MTKNLDQLRQVAERATPGPWAVYDRGIGYEVHDANGCELNGGMRETFTEADATHIATFDPPTALALIDRAEAAEQAVQRVREVIDQLDDHSRPRTAHKFTLAKLLRRALDGGEQSDSLPVRRCVERHSPDLVCSGCEPAGGGGQE